MQITFGSVVILFFVFPFLVILVIIRKLAILTFRDNSYKAYTWWSSLGKQLANSKSMKFSIIFTTALIGSTIILLFSSLGAWSRLLYYGVDVIHSFLWSAPMLLTYLLMGLLYVTMTDRGLSWWDANVIIFRYVGYHERRSYLREQIEDLIEENLEGIENPFRAFLTLERLYMHEFNVGVAAREIISQIAPDYYEEFESSLMQKSTKPRPSYIFLLVSLMFGIVAATLDVFGPQIQLANYNNALAVDILIAIFSAFLLLWIIHTSLELPLLRPDAYLAMQDGNQDIRDSQTYNE